jgi:guanine deaminase
MTKAILGSFFHTPLKGQYEYSEKSLITLNNDGLITQVLTPDNPDYLSLVNQYKQLQSIQEIPEGCYLLPGMVDLHIHAPQWPQAGKGLDLPLDQWLMNYTFPLESQYSDLSFAETVYPHLVTSYLAHGTTTAVYFATIDLDSSIYLSEVCLRKGQRAFVGRVAMDEKNMCPDYYVDDDYQASINLTEAFIQAVHSLKGNNGLVQPVVTPRFVPTCSMEALSGLGQLAQKYDCVVQSHASESDWARDFSQQKYGKTDVEIYLDAGLLGRKTILAHSIFLSQSDIGTVKSLGSSVAHCPLSNIFFANAALPAREMLDNDVQIGLGSDVAASPYPSLFRCCFDAVTHSRARENGTDHSLDANARGVLNSRISLLEAYWMATVGGAKSLDLNVGQLSPGYYFDALCIDTRKENSDLRIYGKLDSEQDIFEKIISHTTPENITKVWIAGKAVKGS